MEILKETDLKIEDVLPFFPDFVKIGSFKVCTVSPSNHSTGWVIPS